MTNQENSEKKPSVFNALGSKKSFYFGIILSFLSMCTIGFVTLLVTNENVASTKTSNSVVAANPTPVAPSPAPSPTPSGEINIKPISEKDHVKGNIDKAKLTIVEFSDTECPFCKKVHPTLAQIVDDYDGQVAWVYRHFPLDSLHSKARKEAEATECAAELGGNTGFWAYLDRLIEITPSNNGLDPAQLPQIAKEVGIDVAKFTECLDSGKMASLVAEDLADASASGGAGTPYSVIISDDGTKTPVSGAVPIDSFKQVIDGLL